MATWIALFRGINVGGKNILPMKELTRELEKLGYTGIETYIQSGNVVFQSPRAKAGTLARRIGEAIAKSHGIQSRIIVLSAKQLEDAAASNPYPEAEGDPKSLHLSFLAHAPESPDLETLNQLKSGSESFTLLGDVFYLRAPAGIGRSKLAARAEKALGVAATARNWRTVTRLIELARGPRRR
jgi:uncharacterized protein (DUF1697 family)